MMKITTNYVMGGLDRVVSTVLCNKADTANFLQYAPGSVIRIEGSGALIIEPWCEVAGYTHRRTITMEEIDG